jgi:hypothetical protein
MTTFRSSLQGEHGFSGRSGARNGRSSLPAAVALEMAVRACLGASVMFEMAARASVGDAAALEMAERAFSGADMAIGALDMAAHVCLDMCGTHGFTMFQMIAANGLAELPQSQTRFF